MSSSRRGNLINGYEILTYLLLPFKENFEELMEFAVKVKIHVGIYKSHRPKRGPVAAAPKSGHEKQSDNGCEEGLQKDVHQKIQGFAGQQVADSDHIRADTIIALVTLQQSNTWKSYWDMRKRAR